MISRTAKNWSSASCESCTLCRKRRTRSCTSAHRRWRPSDSRLSSTVAPDVALALLLLPDEAAAEEAAAVAVAESRSCQWWMRQKLSRMRHTTRHSSSRHAPQCSVGTRCGHRITYSQASTLK